MRSDITSFPLRTRLVRMNFVLMLFIFADFDHFFIWRKQPSSSPAPFVFFIFLGHLVLMSEENKKKTKGAGDELAKQPRSQLPLLR